MGRGTAERPAAVEVPSQAGRQDEGPPGDGMPYLGVDERVHVVIMGCGRVGSTLAATLESRGHSVAIIDQNGDAFRRLAPAFTGQTVTGIGFDREVLATAGITRADAFAAVSSGDNSNIISARLARETYGVNRVVARIYDAKRAEVYERLGVPTVASVRWTADRIIRHLVPEGPAELWRDPTSMVAILDVPVHHDWLGRRVSELEEAAGARVAYLMRFGLGTLPTESTVLQEGDQVFFLVTDDIVAPVTKVAGTRPGG
jgi:trk system potassium uptake protein